MNNSFDFSIYDPEDTAPKAIVKKKPQDKKEEPISSQPFDFAVYESEPQTQLPQQTQKKQQQQQNAKPKSKNPFAVPNLSAEEYNKLSFREKTAYAEAIEKEHRYNISKGLTKGFLGGASLDLSENIPGLEPEEDDDWIAKGFGNLAGSTLPISATAGILNPVVGKAFQYAPKILEPLRLLTHAFSTGGAYESAKQGANALSGKEVDLTEIPKTATTFAVLNTLFQGSRALKEEFSKISFSNQKKILEEGIIPENLPKSQFDTAEEMLNLMKEQQRKPSRNLFNRDNPDDPTGGGGSPPPPPPPGSNIGYASRRPQNSASGNNQTRIPVTRNGEDMGLRPPPQRATPNLQDEVGNIFSPNRFYNTTQGGHALRNEIMKIDEDVYKGVNALYDRSRELNAKVSEIHPQLANRLQARIDQISAIPEPSDIERRLLRASQNILNRVATIGENGEVTGHLPINNQTIIDQIQSLRKIIDYDFAHGNAKNIFRPLIGELQDSALRAAENSATPEAAQAINEARAGYREWVKAFDNEYVRPFRDASNQDFSKLFKGSLDLDESNMLRTILSTTPRGQELVNGTTREIVEKHLSKFFENPRGANPREFDKALRELEAVVTPEQTQLIRDQFREAAARPNIRARQQSERPATNDEKIAAKYLEKKPEDIQRMMNSRSGIRELRKDFSTPKNRENFERLRLQKIRSLMRKGNIEQDFTGNDLKQFLNNEAEYELMSELLGEEETEGLRLIARDLGNKQVRSEARKKNFSNVMHHVSGVKTIEFILGLL